MVIEIKDNVIKLNGICKVEEAETLLEHLKSNPGMVIDASNAEHIHTSLIQVIMALNTKIKALPKNEELSKWITACTNTVSEGED